MKNKAKTDKNDNPIGDGSSSAEYQVHDFPDYPQVSSSVSKSETTESVYVKYFNSDNNESVTVRFSHHENNAVKFGDQLNGFSASRNQILHGLDLIDRVFIPDTYLSISNSQVTRSASHRYEEADLTIQEMYALGEGADISMYKGKRAFGSNRVIYGEKVEMVELTRPNSFGQSVKVGKFEYKERSKQKSIESLIDQFKAQLKIELKSCSKGIYPSICKIKDTDRGFEEVFKNVYDICSKTGMPIDSALAQYESTLN